MNQASGFRLHASPSRYAAVAFALIAAAALIEFAMGRTWICRCGYLKLWHGVVYSAENSQHLTDWYTFSHVLHGLGFYCLLWLAARRTDWRARLVAAVALESAWEVAENTPMVIDRYRAATIALDYYGDSIANSVADIVAMAAGFWIARKARAWVSVATFVTVELALAAAIRDNLTMNIVMLIYPLEFIKTWQLGQ